MEHGIFDLWCMLPYSNAVVLLILGICFALFQFHPGKNVGIGKDHTIFSLIDGLVKFEKFGPDHKKKVEIRVLNLLIMI